MDIGLFCDFKILILSILTNIFLVLYKLLFSKINSPNGLLIFALLALSCSEDLIDGEGSGTLKGSVRLQKTNEPMENVKITTTPSTETVYTDKEGNFEIRESIPIGDYSVKAEKSGYVTEFEAINIQKYDQMVSIVIEMITDESLNSPPSVPELLSPENNEINVAKDVVLKWNSEYPEE